MTELSPTTDTPTVEPAQVTVEQISSRAGAEPVATGSDDQPLLAVSTATDTGEGSQLEESSTSVWPVCRASFLDDPAAAPEPAPAP